MKKVAGARTIVALLIILIANGGEERYGIIYDISLAVFGSALLTWLVAIVEQYQDRKIIHRTVIKNMLKTQREMR